MKSKILTLLFVLGCCGFAFSQATDGICTPATTVDVIVTDPAVPPATACSNGTGVPTFATPTGSLPDTDFVVEVNGALDVINQTGTPDATLVDGDVVCVTAINYDLATIDGILTNASGVCQPGGFLDCDGTFGLPGLGQTIADLVAGVNDGVPGLNSLDEALALAASFGTPINNVADAVVALDAVNAAIAGFFPPGICYATSASVCYTIDDTDAACAACAIAPIAAPTAPTVPTESTCPDGINLAGGVIDYTATTCPADATLEYSTDGGTNWVTVAPMYDQANAITVTVRCLCDEDMATASPTAEVTTVPGECTVVPCGIAAGNPSMATNTVCNTELGAVDVTAIFGDPGPAGTPSLVQNYAVTDPATGDLITISNTATLDLSSVAVGGQACVQAIAYTQETLDVITMAIDDFTGIIPGFPQLGMLDLSGFLNGLNGAFELVGVQFTAADIQMWCETQTLTIPFSSLGIPGVGDLVIDLTTLPGLAPTGFCCDFSDSDYCLTVENCLDPCDAACENDLYIQIESIEIVDPSAVVGSLPFTNGCAGLLGLDGTDGFIEVDITVNGFALPQISVDGGTAGTTAGPWGGFVSLGVAACGEATVTSSVSVTEEDVASDDDLTDNTTEAFDIAGGTFTACGGNIIITYSANCIVDCAACSACPAITAVDTPVDGCNSATAQTICVTYDQDPTGLVTADINGIAGTIDAAAMTICYDIPMANTTCDVIALDIIHNATCDDDGSDILLSDGVTNTNGLNLGPINVFPQLSVVVAGDGMCGSLTAELQDAGGNACDAATAVTCTDAETLAYDFSTYAYTDGTLASATACPPANPSGTLTCSGCTTMGCTDACAPNYDPAAGVDDGSCMPYDMTCNTDCTAGPFNGTWDANTCACINETAPVNGCTDPAAPNYDAAANCDDGSCQAPGAMATITDPCNCTNGIDTDGDASNGLELAAETITITDPAGAGETWTLTANNGELVEMDGMTASSGTATDNGDGTYTFSGFVLADGVTIYTASFTNAAGDVLMIQGGPCAPCPVNIPTVGQWGLIILGLLMSITAVVGIRQRREEEAYS